MYGMARNSEGMHVWWVCVVAIVSIYTILLCKVVCYV